MMHVAMVVGVLGMALVPPGTEVPAVQVLAVQVPAVQEPEAQPAPESATNPWLVPRGKDKFGNIFIHPGTQTGRRVRDLTPSGDAQPRIVCGMTIVPVTPAADPKMVVSPKPDSRVEFKIRVVSPRVCRD